jgi:uncharacterized protein (DUF1330 family)
MSAPFVLVASLWIRDGRVAEFEAYERKAARIMRRHGGAIERAIRVDAANAAADAPFEAHVVTFPDRARFDAYRADSELLALAAEREAAIAKTVVLTGTDAAYIS